MKTIILHGSDVTKSYARLASFISEAKKRGWDIVNDVVEDTPSLFGTEKLIIIRKYQLLTAKDLNVIKDTPGTLVIYSEGDIPQKFISSLSKVDKIEKYELPKIVWGFLDRLDLLSYYKVVESEPVEFVFSLISSRLKEMYLTKKGLLNLPAWRMSKLKKQSDKYNLGQLTDSISDLSQIDIQTKTGQQDLQTGLLLFMIKFDQYGK